MKLVWVKWRDCSEIRGPLGVDDCGKMAYLYSAGHLISITDEVVCL